MALAALFTSLGAVALGLWLLRLPLAGLFIGAALAERGAEADFRVTQLEWSAATLSDVRFGSEVAPDARVAAARIDWRWRGLSPRLTGIHLTRPDIRLSVDPQGRLSAGALDHLRSEPSRTRPSIPAIRLDVDDGRAEILAPFGTLHATYEAAGVLGEDFSGAAHIDETTQANGDFALERGAADALIVSRNGDVAVRLTASAAGLRWNGMTVESASARIMGQAPLDLSRVALDVNWRAGAAQAGGFHARGVTVAATAEAMSGEDTLTLGPWESAARLAAADISVGGGLIEAARLEARAAGRGDTGRGGWTFNAASLDEAGVLSRRPSASGEFEMDGEHGPHGTAQVLLDRAHLTDSARRRLRAALPDLSGAPVGPALARARTALDAASAAFSLSIPISHAATAQGVRIWLSAPAQARAASGARLVLSALRDDAPAFVLTWPGLALHGAVALELSGGRAPSASLLLDSVDWTPEAPFEADGTLTLANWRAENSSIAADELGIGIYIAPTAGGHVDLTGPVRISGPLGDGEVRDMLARLDLAVAWDASGWRAAPRNSCQNISLGGVEAAGLAFSNGAFALCPLDGALIAANARGALSGGFTVQRLSLAGRMAGPGAQPARLSAANVVGRFRGRVGAASLNLQADAPALAIDLSGARTLALTLHSLSAEAHLARDWRVEGNFEQGLLTDPNLPGSVSAIAGRWRAAPEEGGPIINIEAGEALLTANRPESQAERPLFNPLRLVETNAVLRAGQIDAQGEIVLAEHSQQLAHFTATHDVRAGAGSARVTADNLAFNESLQPYDVTERARGLVENVRGAATIVGDVTWTNDTIRGSGRMTLSGVSLATATIPIVEDVRGDIAFDDLFALTTPPGQEVTVGLVDPGIAVRNGRVRFQLLADQHISIEQAEFDFASGVLSMQPTTIRTGADETRIDLELRNVDAADLVSRLNMPDIAVTGRIEGRFPLVLTRRSALITDGVLRAREGGGTIAYTGEAGAGATGAARVAFDALNSFHYNELELTLNGDLSGEVVSAITFSGENSGRPVDLGPIAPLPGVGRVVVRGVPFAFNVRVTAPFRRLAEIASSITDPGALLDRAQESEQGEAPARVDQPTSPPR